MSNDVKIIGIITMAKKIISINLSIFTPYIYHNTFLGKVKE
jgi:hypothetical protein